MNTSILESGPKPETERPPVRPLSQRPPASRPCLRSPVSGPCSPSSSSSSTSRRRTSAFSTHSSTTATSSSASSSLSPATSSPTTTPTAPKTLNKRQFWLARFSRLYPVYLFVLLISLRMVQDEWHARPHAEFWQGIILTPFVLQGWSPSVATFWNTVAWTLTSECVLYLAFPWLIRLPWPKKPAQLVLLLLGLWIDRPRPPLSLSLSEPRPHRRPRRPLQFLPTPPFPQVHPAPLCLHLPHRRHPRQAPTRPHPHFAPAPRSLRPQPRRRWIFFYTLVSRTPYLLMHGGLLTPVFAALVLGLSGPHPISALFSWRPLLLIGESSYCLYLLHFNVFQLLHIYHRSRTTSSRRPGSLALLRHPDSARAGRLPFCRDPGPQSDPQPLLPQAPKLASVI